MSKSQISKRYAKAVFDLAVGQGNVSEVLNDLNSLIELAEQDNSINNLISSPVSTKSNLIDFIGFAKESLKIQDLSFKFLNILVENKRLDLISAIKDELLKLSRQKDQVVEIDVTSVYKLSEAEIDSVKLSLKGLTSFKIILNNVVDQSILGGLVIKIGSKLIDTSLKSSVRRISQNMKEAI